MTTAPQTAEDVIAVLEDAAESDLVEKVGRFYAGTSLWNVVMGVHHPSIFQIAKPFTDLALPEIERLLDDPRYEVRMAAVSIMDFQAAKANLPEAARQALFDLYLRRHDRIDTWDLVDRAAPKVVGRYLVDKDRSTLDDLALSDDPWRRRTAIVASFAFLRLGETEDTFRIAGLLAGDPHRYVQKAVGSWLREAGKHDEATLVAFLRAYRDVLPRPTRRTASEKLGPALQAEFRG